MIYAELQAATIELAQEFGWRVVKFQADAALLPDLVFGTPTAEQRIRMDALTDAGVLAVAWAPEHLLDGTIEHHLDRCRAAPR